MTIFQNVLLGSILIIITTIIHAIATKGILDFIQKHVGSKKKKYWLSSKYWIAIIVVVLFVASYLEAVVWAFAYLFLNVIQGLEEAIYFSLVTFTTVGYGDITLGEGYRILASIEASNGIIIFGWSTAVVMAIVQRIYFKSNPAD